MALGFDHLVHLIRTRQVDLGVDDSNDPNLPHDDQGPQLNFTIWLLAALSFGFLALRIYCKFLRSRGLWWDDYVLIAAWISLAIACATTSVCVSLGYGKHFWDMDPNIFPQLNLVSSVAGTFSILAALWSKTSFAMTVLRISSGWMRWVIWFIIMSLNVVMGASAMFEWIKCTPVEKGWISTIDGTCWPQEVIITFYTFSTIYSGVGDIVLAIFPWKIIWGMTMNKKEKLGVLFAMSMGVFAGAASLIKAAKLPSLSDPDPSKTVELVIWGVAEGAITIIAASIPILRALLRDGKELSAGVDTIDFSSQLSETNATGSSIHLQPYLADDNRSGRGFSPLR